MIKVSIVIPVFNVQKYLHECLDSLINQTLKDIEIICINDGSTDNSLNILKEYALKDSRIKVIDKENEGQGIARNLGIELAQGEFIGFVDPDDWLEPEMLEMMYNQAKVLFSQVVICDYKKYFEDDNKYCDVNIFRKAVSLTKSKAVKFQPGENIDKKLLDSTLLVSPSYTVNAIYDSNLLKNNDIKFSDLRCYEDVIFNIRTRVLAQKVSYINSALYCYRIRKTSTLRANDKRYIDLINVIGLVKDYLTEQNMMEHYQYNFDYFCVSNVYRVFTLLPSDEARQNLLILAESVLPANLLKVLQKKFFVSVVLLKDLFLHPLFLKQKLENLFYYKKYLFK